MIRALLACALVTALGAVDTITLRADTYLPYNGDPKSEKPGFMIEIAKEVFGLRGAVVDYQLMPWSRVVEAVEAGTIDGAVGGEPAGTPTLAFPGTAQGIWKPVLATPAASTWVYAGPASLADRSIGVVQDYDYGKDAAGHSYTDWFAANPKKIQALKGDRPNDLAVGMLAKGRLDLFIEDWGVIQAACVSAKVDLATLRNAGEAGPGYELFIAFAPTERGKALAKELGDGTAALRANGKLATILARYGVADWVK
jgi:polar amino acid transport system substrate-binding protein